MYKKGTRRETCYIPKKSKMANVPPFTAKISNYLSIKVKR